MNAGDQARVSEGAAILARGALRLTGRGIDRGSLRRLIVAGSMGVSVALRRRDSAQPVGGAVAWPACGGGARSVLQAWPGSVLTAATRASRQARIPLMRGVAISAGRGAVAKILTSRGSRSVIGGTASGLKIRRAIQAAGGSVGSERGGRAAIELAHRSVGVVLAGRSVAPVSREDASVTRKAMVRAGPVKDRPSPPAGETAIADFQRALRNRLARMGSLPPGAASGFDPRVGPDWYGIGSLS